jgi:hypothetical protein
VGGEVFRVEALDAGEAGSVVPGFVIEAVPVDPANDALLIVTRISDNAKGQCSYHPSGL